jgi:hypothetical protein
VARLLPARRTDQLPSEKDLLVQTLLHLPRIADEDGFVDRTHARLEIDQVLRWRTAELEPLAELATPPAKKILLDELELSVIDEATARPILEHFHYLRSFRPDGIAVAATHRARVVALATVASLDLRGIARTFASYIDSECTVLVVSRVFAFDWTPRNAISYLLARLKRRPEFSDAGVLLTYLNPNLGFTGASYRAANWGLVGYEVGTRYAYLDGRYVTDRQIQMLAPEERRRLQYSRMTLAPLQLYASFRDRRLGRLFEQPFVVARDEPVRVV